jgi:hypothetical protein
VSLDDGDADVFRVDADSDHHDNDHDGEHVVETMPIRPNEDRHSTSGHAR